MSLDEKLARNAAWLIAFAVDFQFQKLNRKIVSGLVNFLIWSQKKYSKHFKSGLGFFFVCVCQ